MTLDELAGLIKTRRSIRKWQEKSVPESLLMQAIELATWAPNGGNAQGWRFYLILNRGTINALADAVQSTHELLASWPESQPYSAEVNKSRQNAGFFRSAPAAIAVATGRYSTLADQILEARWKVDPEAAKMRDWRSSSHSRIQSVGAAVATLILVLHQMGLGTVYMTGPMQAKGLLEKILNVPAGLDLMAFIPVGYPAETPTKTRKPVSEVCEVIR